MHTKFDVLCLYPKAIYLFPTLKNVWKQKTQNIMISLKNEYDAVQKISEFFLVTLQMNDFVLREVYKSQLCVF